MIYSLIIVAAIGVLVFWYRRWQKKPEAERRQFTRQTLLWGAAALVLVLVISGRAHWLLGVLAALLAMAGRIAQFIQFIPLFKKIFGDDVQAGQGRPASSGQTMTRRQAADFLGVEINASEQEIRAAHKRLMQKIHPDRGGSDALAKQINQARDLLLK